MPHSLRTQRLLLRPATLRDAKGLARSFNDFDLTRATKTWPYPVTEEHARFRIRHWQKVQGKDEFGFLAFYQGRVVGSLGFSHRSGDVWSLGYGIARECWGQGMMSEAVGAFCAFGFKTLRFGAIEADVFKDNPGSIKVLEKTGFEMIGDIGPGWSTTLQGNFPRWGYRLTRERLN
jgi:[ribosomal protein S5]-alanine N-acetyltransferase